MTTNDSLLAEATCRARQAHISPEAMADAMRAHRNDRPFVTELEATTAGGAFFRVTQEGPSRVLYLNLDHPFYSTIYDPPGATAQYRSALEILLWVIGIEALEATGERRTTYLREFHGWSQRLNVAAPILDELLGYPDERDRLANEEDS